MCFRTPILYKLMTEGVRRQKKQLSAQKSTGIITVLCKIANIYNPNLSAYQKLFGLNLRTSGTTKRAINKACQLYDSVSYSTLTTILDDFAFESRDMMKSWVGETTIHCGDNLDIQASKRHECGGSSYHDVHLYNNLIYKSRLNVDHLSDIGPTVNLGDDNDIDYSKFLLNKDEEMTLLNHMAYHIKCSWNTLIFESSSPEKPPHRYPKEAKQKTEKVGCYTTSFLFF